MCDSDGLSCGEHPVRPSRRGGRRKQKKRAAGGSRKHGSSRAASNGNTPRTPQAGAVTAPGSTADTVQATGSPSATAAAFRPDTGTPHTPPQPGLLNRVRRALQKPGDTGSPDARQEPATARRVRELEAENARLRRELAEEREARAAHASPDTLEKDDLAAQLAEAQSARVQAEVRLRMLEEKECHAQARAELLAACHAPATPEDEPDAAPGHAPEHAGHDEMNALVEAIEAWGAQRAQAVESAHGPETDAAMPEPAPPAARESGEVTLKSGSSVREAAKALLHGLANWGDAAQPQGEETPKKHDTPHGP